MVKRLGIFVTHPIQYFAPLWRKLAASSGLSVRVHFFSDHSVRGGQDPEFKVPVAWDTPLLEGYDHSFICRAADLSRPLSISLPNARTVLREGGFDSVMINGYMHRFEIQIIRAARDLGISVLFRGELTDTRPFKGRWFRRLVKNGYLKWFYSHVGRFCYIGHNARQHLRRFGVSEDRMFFSPYSVDSDLFEEQQARFERDSCRKQLRIEPEQLVLLFSGKFIPRKAPLLLLQAISQLREKERITLIMLGDGELRQEVEAEAKALLGNRAVLPGFVNQTKLGLYFRAADIFVLPSEFETWGLVVNEAMLFGLPVVVSSGVGCGPDLIRNGETGLVFPVKSADGLAAALQEFIDEPSLADRMGDQGRTHIRGYSTDASVRGIRQALDVNS